MSKFSTVIFAAFFSVFFGLDAPARADLGGVKGRYTQWLDEVLKSKSYEHFVKEPSLEPVSVTCLETAGERFYIGVVQNMRVQAPIERLQSVVSNINSYVELFPGFKAIRVTSQAGPRLMTYWEQRIPVFFIPNVRYEMIYELAVDDPSVKIYHYQLNKKSNLRESDGFIVLEKITDGETRYIEVDFFDADWGVLTTFAPGRIWTDSVDGLYLSDLAFLKKAEHPDWSNTRCREEADKIVDEMKKKPGERCVADKQSDWGKAFPGIPLPNSSK
jgi:hypothetical protein